MSRLFPEPRVIELGALEALRPAELPKGKVTVVLANHFVRYALVPWSAALSGAAEELAYVRHHFVRIHGERAKSWSFRASPAAAGAPRLCSAIDATLLEDIKRTFAAAKARLASVQPRLMYVFNRFRAAVPAAGAWIVLAEPERACVALHGRNGWQAVQNGRGEWLALLERERHRIGGETPQVVLLHGAAAPAQAAGWKVQPLAA